MNITEGSQIEKLLSADYEHLEKEGSKEPIIPLSLQERINKKLVPEKVEDDHIIFRQIHVLPLQNTDANFYVNPPATTYVIEGSTYFDAADATQALEKSLGEKEAAEYLESIPVTHLAEAVIAVHNEDLKSLVPQQVKDVREGGMFTQHENGPNN